jgi:hypothetical protein
MSGCDVKKYITLPCLIEKCKNRKNRAESKKKLAVKIFRCIFVAY